MRSWNIEVHLLNCVTKAYGSSSINSTPGAALGGTKFKKFLISRMVSYENTQEIAHKSSNSSSAESCKDNQHVSGLFQEYRKPKLNAGTAINSPS
jgi:hypothetical protein